MLSWSTALLLLLPLTLLPMDFFRLELMGVPLEDPLYVLLARFFMFSLLTRLSTGSSETMDICLGLLVKIGVVWTAGVDVLGVEVATWLPFEVDEGGVVTDVLGVGGVVTEVLGEGGSTVTVTVGKLRGAVDDLSLMILVTVVEFGEAGGVPWISAVTVDVFFRSTWTVLRLTMPLLLAEGMGVVEDLPVTALGERPKGVLSFFNLLPEIKLDCDECLVGAGCDLGPLFGGAGRVGVALEGDVFLSVGELRPGGAPEGDFLPLLERGVLG